MTLLGRVALTLVTGWWFAFAATAHELRPAFLQITQTSASNYEVMWKVPARGDTGRLALNVRFEGLPCKESEPQGTFVGGAHVRRWQMACPQGIAGARVTIDGLSRTFTDALIRVDFADGSEFVRRLQADSPSTEISATAGDGEVLRTYLTLGTEHILLGIDHLLFVFALLLIVKGKRKLIGTITAFTLAHSITLALATLGYVRLPGPPVEAVIALSIVLVALEILHKQRGEYSLTARWPWLVAFVFGLLHGFGFAGALAELGLPQTAVPLALFSFNVGVEAGQLLFVTAVLLVGSVVKKLPLEFPVWTARVPPYVIGCVAMYWVFDRSWFYTFGAPFG
ncbi:HupE/UreJ family protein [Alteromonas aestuariivivens]|uniref:HupE/UreJ family protein n=1 Tax=Alteromonas aestuariivivens TaxID=1938339 RepID=A0A3D8MDV0_9ALTE|nr:HupE/UreJ family protein [Alteromonas aestuariivivens]RDV29017.1 HupE/UreJ family protein [Alteromonas aestuariivivens]